MLFARRRKPDLVETLRYTLWPRGGWKRAVLYRWKRLLRLSATPYAVAAGGAAGVFVAFSPLLGLHMLSAALIAWLLRASVVAAVIGTTVANPVTIPVMWGASYEVGTYILSGGADPVRRAHATPAREASGGSVLREGFDEIRPILLPLLAGSVPLGLAAAAGTYAALHRSVSRLQARRRERISRQGAGYKGPRPLKSGSGGRA
jgi:uncharacterized protein (DUF2062 family)